MRTTNWGFQIAALALLAGFAIAADAQIFGGRRPDSGPLPKNIRGTVTDLRGKPLPGVRVFVRDMKTNVIRTLSADEEGVYSIFGLPPDVDYEVYAEFRGQESEKKFVTSFLNRRDNVLNLELDVAAFDTVAGGPSEAVASGPELETYDLVLLRASFDLPSGVPAPIPAVLLLHGYGEDRFVWNDFKEELIGRGWAVMALDLRGHGESNRKNLAPIESSPAWRASPHEFPLDLDPALDWLKAQPRIDNSRIVVIGSDIGANLALLASSKFLEVRTVIAFHPSLTESLGITGSAQDFHPKSALIVASDQDHGEQIQEYVVAPSRVLVRPPAEDTSRAFDDETLVAAIFQWLAETY